MEIEKTQAAAQPPVMEEHTFSGALFGFRRKDVLEYVRTLSESNENYIRSLDESIASLQQELDGSRADARRMEQRIDELHAELESGAVRDAEKQQELEKTTEEFRACREKLFHREQKYVQLQTECSELRRQNGEITRQMEAARELLQRNQEQLAAAAEREKQMEAEYDRRLEEAVRAAQAQREQLMAAAAQREEQLAADAARKEEQLQQEHSRAVRRLNEEKQQEMQELETDARGILSRLGACADMEQERLTRGVERVDAELEELHTEMEQVQQQIWAAHAMIRQTTLDMDELIRRAQSEIRYAVPRPVSEDDGYRFAAGTQPAAPQTVPTPPAAAQMPAGEAVAAKEEAVETADVPPQPADAPVAKESAAAQTAEPSVARVRSAANALPHSSRPQPTHTTVRSSRETVADYLLDALGRLWDKR